MTEIKESELKRADAHHSYTYEYGRKIKNKDSGIVYLYKDKYGLLHATSWEDTAAEFGRYIATDEVEEREGLPFVYGSVYTIFGAGDGFVYLTKNKDNDSVFHTSITSNGSTTVVPHGKELKRASCELLRQMYLLLEDTADKSNE